MSAAPWMDFLGQNFKFSTLRSNLSSALTPPLQKCCSYDEMFSYLDGRCVPFNFSSTFANAKQDPRPNASEFRIVRGLKCFEPSGPLTYSWVRDSAQIMHFFGNGSLNVFFGRMKEPKHFELGEYCVDVTKEMLDPMLLTCQSPVVDGFGWFAIVFFASLFLWVTTFSLYLVVPELRRRVYDKCFICFMGFGILSLLLILFRSAIDPRRLGIKTRFITLMCIYYMLMFSYCWLNMTCIHMWRTVTTTKIISGRSFYAYAAYALGLPVICCSAFLVDLHITGWEMMLHRYFGRGLLSDPVLLYFIHVCAIQQFVNLCLFVHVGYVIWYQKQSWRRNSRNSDCGYQRHVRQQKTVISRLIRLSVIMGIDWTNIFLLNYVNSRTNLSNIFYLIYHLNLCPGYVIFITFVCYNEQVISPAKKKYPTLMKVGSFAIKIFFALILAAFVHYVVSRWGKVGRNILVL